MLKFVFLAVTAAALLALGSCGTNNATSVDPDFGNGNNTASSFQLDVMDETFDFGATAQDLTLAVSAETDTHVVVDVVATGAQGLKALYFALEYDPAKYQPMVVEPTDAMGDKADLLRLMAVERPGRMQYGQTLVHQEYQVGFTGSATLAQVSFRKDLVNLVRGTSTPPGPQPASQVTTLEFDGVDQLTWYYAFQGDYGQDGVVSVSDLTPLGANFNEVAPGGLNTLFPIDSVESQVDGDSNGGLFITDLTPIGANIGKDALGGFHVYASSTAADYPSPVTASNGAGATDLGSVLVSAADNVGAKVTQRLAFTFTVGAPVANDVYWVRAVDSAGAPGIASNFAGGDPSNFPALSLDPLTPADSGAGTQANPYLDDADTTDYNFILLDAPGGNDVTGDAKTVFSVTPASAGTFTGNVLDVTGSGSFFVSATYDGIPNHPSTNIYFTIGGAPPAAKPFIQPDDADADWATVVGTGVDLTNAYILRTDTFNSTYTMEFTLKATENNAAGNLLVNSALNWDCFPPFVVSNAAAFTDDATAGTFSVWNFSDGYLFAQDPTQAAPNDVSNQLWVGVLSLEP